MLHCFRVLHRRSPNAIHVQQLLPVEMKAAHAEADAVDKDDVSMLHYAARYGHVAVVSLLLELFGPLATKKLEVTTKSQKFTPFLEAVTLKLFNLFCSMEQKVMFELVIVKPVSILQLILVWVKITQYNNGYTALPAA
jgi:ankyrin repeat protein